MSLLAGRDFTSRDTLTGPLVAIINEAAAQYYFGDENPDRQMAKIRRRLGTLRNYRSGSKTPVTTVPRKDTPRFVLLFPTARTN